MRTRTLVSIATLLFTAGCTVTHARRGTVRYAAVTATAPQSVVVRARPPALRAAVTARPARSAPDAVWVAGYWGWEGQWTWVPGHWERGRSGAVWVAPVAQDHADGVVYHPGYWRSADHAPDPAYARPGTVRVSVRPGAPTAGVVVATRPGGVRAAPPGGGTTATRPGGGVRAAPPRGGTTATRPGGRTRGRPVRSASGGSVTTRGRGGTVHQADNSTQTAATRVGTANATTGSSARTRPGATASRTRPGRAASPLPNVTTSTVATGSAAGSRSRTGATTARIDSQRGPQVRGDGPPLSCRISTPRAPLGGLITITGNGFGRNVVVHIGGSIARIQRRTASQLRVQAPHSPGGGMVRVTVGSRNANCGQISIGSR